MESGKVRVSMDAHESKMIRSSTNLNKRSSFQSTVCDKLSFFLLTLSYFDLGYSYSTINACS
jgi:hypothetical protein